VASKIRVWGVALLILLAGLMPRAASAAPVDLHRTACSAALPDGATDDAIARAAYRCGPGAPTRGSPWLWLRLDPSGLKALPADWAMVVDQTRFDRIAVLTVTPRGASRLVRDPSQLRQHWAPGGMLKFVMAAPGRDVRGLYLGFRNIDDLSLMRKLVARTDVSLTGLEVSWLVLIGLFTGTMLSAFLYNLVIHTGRRHTFQRWYLLWVAVSLCYGLVWTNTAALVVPWLIGPTAVRVDLVLVGLMVAACNMFFFAVVEDGVLPRPLIRVGRWLAGAGAVTGVLATIDHLPPVLTDRLLNYTIAGTAASVAVSCVIAVRRGSRVIWFYLIGWTPVITMFVVRLVRNLGFASQNDAVDMSTFVVLSFEALVLSLAIADRFRLIRQELDLARQRREVDLAEAKTLRSAAQTDFLTGLGNRAAFQHQAQALMTVGTPFSLFLIDVDYLKDVNDRLGHASGDELLRHVAGLLAHVARPFADLRVARIGGDEFVVLCPGPPSREAALATAIGTIQGDRWRPGDPAHSLSLSIGAARFPDDADALDMLYQNADLALYTAKRLGRGRYVRYDPLQRSLRDMQIAVAGEAEGALARGEFMLFLQPIVSLADDTVCGHEALLRWNHPRHGLMTPNRFADLLVADRIGLLIQDHVLDMALALLRDEGERLGVLSVNFTSAQLTGPRSARGVLDRMALHGIAPWRLCIEVTEGVMLDRAADTIMVNLRELHEAGVGIALDDFGTGYASLVHLRQLPVDRIKIDQSFVEGLDQTEDGTFPIVSAIVGLGTGLGKVVVAEGIETEVQANRLRQLGCQLGQGYLYGRPAPMTAPPPPPLAIAG
jgi:diguanylate cyclase (GGDEF)-like protein